MSNSTFTPIRWEPERDRWKRPLVIPPEGGKPIGYTRCTTYVDVLEDKHNLQLWKQRMVAVGLSTRSDLHAAAASLAVDPDENKRKLDEVCEQAVEAAKGSAKATIGTALHAWIERINLGQDTGPVPEEFTTHIANYRAATGMLHPRHVETFTVCDELKVGGTPDLVATIDGEDGLFIVDLKTGPSTLTYGSLKVAMQLAVYAHSQQYVDGHRSVLGDVRQDKGLVVALDSTTGDCQLHWIDIAAGWEAVQVASQVRAWRKRKGLVTPFAASTSPLTVPTHVERTLMDAIAESSSREALLNLWEKAGPAWTDAHTTAAKQRLAHVA